MIGTRLYMSVLMLSLSLLLTTCGAQRELSGIWQQIPLVDNEPLSPDIQILYELHIGQYGDRMTGLSVRYRQPDLNLLSPYDRGDRCDCAYLTQGLIDNDEEESLAFKIFQPEINRVTSLPVSCVLSESECIRIFSLTIEDDEDRLIGKTWCEGLESERIDVRFERVPGIPIQTCQPVNPSGSPSDMSDE
jgi:hypothetical protein